MKTTTKGIISSVVLIAAIILISSFTNQTTGTKYATIRTVESQLGGMSKIILVYDGITEELELSKGSNSNQTPNTLQINQALNILASKGYQLVAQSGGDVITMYSFIRK